MTTAAIYTRMSEADPETQTGTKRQEAACRAFVRDRGWIAGPVFEDVDVSAFSGVQRPAYERLALAIELGEVDAVVCWKIDRLSRRMSEFERFWHVCETHGTVLASVTEPLDTSSDLGMAMVRILVTFAVLESATMGVRLRAVNKQRALRGLPHNPGVRAYGFNPDWTAVVPREVAVIRDVAKRVLRGESLNAVAGHLNRRGVPSPSGSRWSSQTLNRIMRQPRLVGDRIYHGEVVVRDCFPAVLDRLTFNRVGAELMLRRRTSGMVRFELSGILHCGRCGERMHGVRHSGCHRYACHGQHEGRRCNLTVAAAPVEEIAKRAVLDRIDRRGRLSQRSAVAAAANPEALAAAFERHNQQLQALSRDYYATGIVDRDVFVCCREELERELDAARRELGDASLHPALGPGSAKQLQRTWRTLDLRLKRGLLASEIEMVRVLPTVSTRRAFDTSRVEIVWREPEPVGAGRSRLRWPDDLPTGVFLTAADVGAVRPVGDGVSRDRILATVDVAAMLDVRPKFIMQLARQEKLECGKVGRGYVFSAADVEAFLQRARIVTAAERHGMSTQGARRQTAPDPRRLGHDKVTLAER